MQKHMFSVRGKLLIKQLEIRELFFLILVLWNILLSSAYANTSNNFCSSSSTDLLNIANRPTIADSPCAVSNHRVVVESGAQFKNLASRMESQNLPELNLRLGLPRDSELFFILPNYTHQSVIPHLGASSIFLGFKHVIKYTNNSVFSIDSSLISTTGSDTFGNQGIGGIINSIFSYTINQKLSITAQLGISSETESRFDGGKRYHSINPDAVISWILKDNLLAFTEIYGQSKSGINQGSGFNFDAGLVYLLEKNLSVDLEVGQCIKGQLDSFNQYVGMGLVVQF